MEIITLHYFPGSEGLDTSWASESYNPNIISICEHIEDVPKCLFSKGLKVIEQVEAFGNVRYHVKDAVDYSYYIYSVSHKVYKAE